MTVLFFFNDENQSNRRLNELLRLQYNMYNILEEFQQYDKCVCIISHKDSIVTKISRQVPD